MRMKGYGQEAIVGAKILGGKRDVGDSIVIDNEQEGADGAGTVARGSFVHITETDVRPDARVRLAVKVRAKPAQEVQSLRFWNGRQWNEMVPGYVDDAVAEAAAKARPDTTEIERWRGFLIPFDLIPRPFIGTYTKLRLTNGLAQAQKIEWMATYDPGDFKKGPIVKGHSNLKPHPHRKRSKGAR
jgi:hypothetical protein